MNKPRISAIFAVAENGVIGRDNNIPWYLPADFKHFKKLTSGHPIIMGRKTYDSIGRPLPRRTNIIISRNKQLKIDGCIVVHTLQQAIEQAKEEKPSEIFIVGGASIYLQSMELLDKIYQTIVHISPIGDTTFQIPNLEDWVVEKKEYHPADSKNLVPYSFLTLTRT